jgi:exo-beta-1,3-glucanase (GH17 family)
MIFQGHRRFHRRGDIITDYATVTTPEVIVWVYENGETASIETRTPNVPMATPPPARVGPESSAEASGEPTTSSESSLASEDAVPSPVQAYAQSSSTGDATAPTTTEAASEPPSPEAPAPAPAPAPPSEPAPPSTPAPPSSGLGICYSPYNSDGTCKTQTQVDSDFGSLQGYSSVRIYGVDCNQISTVVSAASKHGMTVFAGLLTISDVPGDLGSMVQQLNGRFDDVGTSITTISIGNELVDMGKAAPADVVAALGTARDILGRAGYTGSIVTVDTFNALIAHPELCRSSDYCAANAHAFFDGTVEPAGAGAWLQRQVGRIGDAVGGAKKVVITESGWPHAGGSNKVAVPSPENQAQALSSLRASFGADLFLFTAFDDQWKEDGAFGVEKNWGIM